MSDRGNYQRRKLTIGDAELRDLFACFITVGLSISRVAQQPNHKIQEAEWNAIAESAYDGAAACIERRKINKEKIRQEYARQGGIDTDGDV